MLLGALVAIDDLSMDHKARDLSGQRLEVIACLFPTRAVVEIEKRHIHEFRLRLQGDSSLKGF